MLGRGLWFSCGFRLRLLFGLLLRLRLRLVAWLGRELLERFAGDFDDRFAILVAQFVGGIQSLAHLRRDIRRCLAHGVFGVRHLEKRHAVEEFCGQGQQYGDLRRNGHRGEFRLLETGPDTPSVIDDLAGVFIKAGAEPGKGLEFFKP